jgi:hypothetical protein
MLIQRVVQEQSNIRIKLKVKIKIKIKYEQLFILPSQKIKMTKLNVSDWNVPLGW